MISFIGEIFSLFYVQVICNNLHFSENDIILIDPVAEDSNKRNIALSQNTKLYVASKNYNSNFLVYAGLSKPAISFQSADGYLVNITLVDFDMTWDALYCMTASTGYIIIHNTEQTARDLLHAQGCNYSSTHSIKKGFDAQMARKSIKIFYHILVHQNTQSPGRGLLFEVHSVADETGYQ